MKEIYIENSIKEKCPDLGLGIIQANIIVENANNELLNEIDNKISEINKNLKIENISQLPNIKASRDGYKKLGKDPTRYRLSAESLLRRIISGKGLYNINNVIDCLNLVSISSGYSIGGYDNDKITGNIKLDIGKANEIYHGIGRGELNIEFLPVFRDDISAFGSPTSDSERTSITLNTTNFLMVFFSFSNTGDIEKYMEYSTQLLKKYCNAKNITSEIK